MMTLLAGDAVRRMPVKILQSRLGSKVEEGGGCLGVVVLSAQVEPLK
jgi:hypothetical protein